MPQLTDEQYAQAVNLDAFVRRGLANPKTRSKLLEIQKTLNPEISVPEIDAANPILEKLNSLEERLDGREQNEANAALASRWNTGREKARRAGYAEEGLANLEKFMEERGILDHQDAMAAFERANPKPTPATNSGAWNFFTPPPDASPDLKLLYEGRDEDWLSQMIPDTLNKVRSGEITRGR